MTRVVRNVLDHVRLPISGWTDFESGTATTTIAGDGVSFTADAGATSGRAFYSLNVTAAAGQAYAFSARFASQTGTSTDKCMFVSGPPDNGDTNSLNVTAAGRHCIRFSFDEETVTTLRVGVGCIGTESTASVAWTISELMLEEIDSVTSAPSEYTPPQIASGFGYANGNSYSSGAITEAAGASYGILTPKTALVIATSFGNTAGEYTFLLHDSLPDWAVMVCADAGRTLSGANSIAAAAYDLSDLTQDVGGSDYTPSIDSGAQTASVVVIGEVAVNTIAGGSSLADSQSHMEMLFATVRAAAPTAAILVANCPPFANAASWTSGKETVRGNFNTWLSGTFLAGKANCALFDIASVLAESGAETELAAAFDSGDGLHPNAAGSAAIAGALAGAIQEAGARIGARSGLTPAFGLADAVTGGSGLGRAY